MTKALFEVTGLIKHFPIYRGIFRKVSDYVKAVDGISFSIHEGEIVGMVGESGSGKSTAGRAAIRLIEPTAGSLFFDQIDLMKCSSKELRALRRDIQMIFQDPYASLNPRKTIFEIISEGLLYHRILSGREELLNKTVEVLEQVGLSADALNRYPHQFSGGQQQRISIGRAIALQPKLLICDEAVASLDISVQAQILNLLYELKEKMGLSFLFISHDLRIIRHFCDKVLVMYLGQIVESATVEELFSSPKHPYTKALLDSTPPIHPLEHRKQNALKGEIISHSSTFQGCPFSPRCSSAHPECLQAPPPQKVVIHHKDDLELRHEYRCILD
jgi:peptide/nickel transport system ATP-binding protein/oligopeptide transport system ATP-binding protein